MKQVNIYTNSKSEARPNAQALSSNPQPLMPKS